MEKPLIEAVRGGIFEALNIFEVPRSPGVGPKPAGVSYVLGPHFPAPAYLANSCAGVVVMMVRRPILT